MRDKDAITQSHSHEKKWQQRHHLKRIKHYTMYISATFVCAMHAFLRVPASALWPSHAEGNFVGNAVTIAASV